MLAAEPDVTGKLPEFDCSISFVPLIYYLKEKRASVSDLQSGFYNYLIEQLETDPALLEPIKDVRLLKKHEDLLELLSTFLFPIVGKQEKSCFALTAPYQFRTIYCSDVFCQLFLDGCGTRLLLPAGMTEEQMKLIQCSMIYDHVLQKFYGIKLNDNPELIYPIIDSQSGMKRYYKIHFDTRFIDIKLKGELPLLKDCGVCVNTFRILDLDLQLRTMPLDLFAIEGFAVWVTEDVTVNESLESIKKILIRHDECDVYTTQELKAAIHELIGLSDIEVGLMPYVCINGNYILEEEFTMHSLIGRHWKANDPESKMTFHAFTNILNENPQPISVGVMDDLMVEHIPTLASILKQGYKSYISYPMQNSDGLLGLLELGSFTTKLLNHEVVSRIEPAIPLLSVAMLKGRNTFHNRIEKLIKEKFTALQQSVQWKFTEVALNHLRETEDTSCSATVVFDDVYPLYGAIDIRNSSLERSRAIQKDLKEHLLLIDDTLDRLQAQVALPLLEGLKFKNENTLTSIQEMMLAEDEVRIHEFIKEEVEPVLCHLQKSNQDLQGIVNHYFKVVNKDSNRLHRHRNEYSETVDTITNAVAQYLAKEEDAIQKTYPHYFDRYRTDGIEYNIYIGQSIAPDHPFDLLYLKNIRLWQLKSMAEIAHITNHLLPTLKVPLQTTQLILIHSQYMSISFRRDERRFDVEGSYNIRYEIIKKRLDKICLKDSSERLTQPGKVALVYSNQKEVQEYQQYIEFLQNKKILSPDIEYLELEEMQGIKGLKAMRVAVEM
jgi:hypothetical protein